MQRYYWCDRRSAIVVANLVLFLRQFANSIFSLNSQQILVNKVSNDRQCSITSCYEEKFKICMKIRKIWAKRSFRSRILEKKTSKANKFCASCETRFPFFNNFQIVHAGSNTIKQLSTFFIFKNNLKNNNFPKLIWKIIIFQK